jgi:acyl-CoA thioesterase FadM
LQEDDMVSKWVGGIAMLAAVGSAAFAASVGSAAAVSSHGVVYAAETAEFEVVTIEVTPARNRVAKLTFGWHADCTPGPAATLATSSTTAWVEYRGGYPINKQGAWKARFAGSKVDGAIRQRFTYSLAGRRIGGRMVGTLQATLVETDAAAQIIRTCSSRAIKYAADEKATFGGLTIGARRPTLVKLNPAGTQVKRIRWDWEGTCKLGPAAPPGTLTTHFESDFVDAGLTIAPNGHFGGSGSYKPVDNLQTGMTRTYRATVVGRRIGAIITATMTAGFIEADTATGGVIRDCASKPTKLVTRD